MIEMKVAGIALDAVTRSPIVLLKDGSERRALPIYIGQDQAKSIIGAIENQKQPRPLTHDLIANLFEAWGASISYTFQLHFHMLHIQKDQLLKPCQILYRELCN